MSGGFGGAHILFEGRERAHRYIDLSSKNKPVPSGQLWFLNYGTQFRDFALTFGCNKGVCFAADAHLSPRSFY